MTDNPDIHLDSSNTIGTQEALPLEATNSGSTSIRLPSTPKQTSYLGVWATRIIFALALTSTITPACKCSDSTELSADVIKYAKELKKIQEAQKVWRKGQ